MLYVAVQPITPAAATVRAIAMVRAGIDKESVDRYGITSGSHNCCVCDDAQSH